MMSDILPSDLRDELDRAVRQARRKGARMRVRVGDETFTILRYWGSGFALDADDAPKVRGLVDIYDGTRHLSQCLIVASSEAPGEMVYEFKRATPHMERPPTDYEIAADAPVALLPGE